MFRTGVPDFGHQKTPDKFNIDKLPGGPGDLGMVYVETNGNYWQLAKNVDGAGVSGTNITGGGVAYWKNYAGYECTPTIGNSSVHEVAGIYELTVTVNYYCALRQGGTRKVKSDNVTFARGTAVVADTAGNQITADEAGTTTGALAAVDTAGGLMSVINPDTNDRYVDLLKLVITGQTVGACTGDFGATATSATTLSDNLIDGYNLASAEATITNYTNPGTNGKVRQLWPAGGWITGSVASGTSVGLEGTYEITWTLAQDRQKLGTALGARDGDGNVSVRLKIIPA